jgi:hypothetical protein
VKHFFRLLHQERAGQLAAPSREVNYNPRTACGFRDVTCEGADWTLPSHRVAMLQIFTSPMNVPWPFCREYCA